MTTAPFKSAPQLGGSGIAVERFGSAETEEASQRVGPFVEIPALLRELGVDATEVWVDAGLDADALDSPENRVSFVLTGRLLRVCAVKTRCPHFALLLGQRLRLSHLGLPGQLALHSPTVGAGLRTFAVYQHLNSEGMATVVQEKDGIAILGPVVFQKGTEDVDQIYDLAVAAALSIMRELCGTHWRPERVFFSHAKPMDVGPYRRFFGAPCRFDSERTALVFPAGMLERRLASADPRLLRSLEAQAQARTDFDLPFKLRGTLRTLLLSGEVSCDKVASVLSMHRRTLNRRLRSEGTTFQELLDEVRFEAACQLLDTARTPVTEIAASLGYAETSAFSRAFRRWSGSSPVERREKFGKQGH